MNPRASRIAFAKLLSLRHLTSNGKIMARVTHFELSVDDPKRAISFFEKVFDWKFQQWGDQEYWLASTGDEKQLGINGAIQPRKPDTPSVVNTIGVTDLDDTIQKIKKYGGEIVTDKMDIPQVGTMVYFKDSEGNLHGAIQPLAMM